MPAGGKANKDGTREDLMRNQADDPGLHTLKDIILRDKD